VGESSGEGEEERREASPVGSDSFVAMVGRWRGVKRLREVCYEVAAMGSVCRDM
jgi:hypothetical protein